MKTKGYVYREKSEGCWYARITITDGSGKRRNIKKRAKDRSDARGILKALTRQIDEEGSAGLNFAKLTFNDLADFYEKHFLKPAEYVDGKKIAGLRDLKRPLACVKIFREYFGKRKLREITYRDVHTYRSLRLRTSTQYNKPRTIGDWNREGSVLRRMFAIAQREGWLLKNPFAAGEPLIVVSFERRRERILTLDEERRFLEACRHPQRRHLRPLVVCLLDTGARKSEMLKLRWRSVSLRSRTITIEGMTTKTLKTRQVAMTERVYQELQSLWDTSSKDQNRLVFGLTCNVKHSFRSACKAAGLDHGGCNGLTLHSLRHTAATRLVKGQMPLQMVGRILGHSQPQTTYRYLSADTETAAQAAAIFDALQVSQIHDASSDANLLVN